METSPLPVKGCKIWSMLGTHGPWVVKFFSVPHLLWQGSSVYNGHLRGHVALTPAAERWQWSCHYLFFTTSVAAEYSNTQPSMELTDCLLFAFASLGSYSLLWRLYHCIRKASVLGSQSHFFVVTIRFVNVLLSMRPRDLFRSTCTIYGYLYSPKYIILEISCRTVALRNNYCWQTVLSIIFFSGELQFCS